MDQRSRESQISGRSFGVAVNWRARFLRLWNDWCKGSVCIEKDHLQFYFQKHSHCRRATCTKIRPILTRETSCLHNPWPLSSNRSSWCSSRPIRSFSMFHYTEMTFKMSTQDGIKRYWPQVKFLRKMSRKGSYRLWKRDSVQLSDCVGCVRPGNGSKSCNGKLSKIEDHGHIDQMTRTRNVKARNERIETGVLVVIVTKGEQSALREEVGECHQWKATGQCSRGESCSVSHREVVVDRKHNRPLLLQKRRHRLTEETPRKVWVPGDTLLLEEMGRKRAKKSSKKSARIRRVTIGILPHVKITSLYRDAKSATNVCLDTLRLKGSP